MTDLISVIVPVYKVEDYLDECVRSICNQSYRNLEIILVDDGSPDDCPTMCDKYAGMDSRIKVIHKKNGGLSDARNAGIRIATGDYIGFVDSDDWIEQDMYETLLREILEHHADIAEIGVNYCYANKIEHQKADMVSVLGKQEALEAFLDRSLMIQGCVWGKLYRSDIVRKVMFPVGRLHEDGYFTYKALYEATTYVLLDVCKYNYRQDRPGSIMTTTARQNPKSIYDVIDAFEERNDFFEAHGEALLAEKAKAYYYKTLVSEYQSARAGKFGQETMEYLKQKIQILNKDILKNRQLGLWKVKYILFLLSMIVFK